MTHVNKELVAELREEMEAHAKADRIIKGDWLQGKDSSGVFRGCFYGCLMQTSDNAIEKACEKYQLPFWLGYWSERVFEGLMAEDAMEWPVRLADALLEYDGDLDDTLHELAIKRLSYLSERAEGKEKEAINQVIEYHITRDEGLRELAVGSAWSSAVRASVESAWSETRAAARRVAWSAESAAESAGKWGAWKRERDWMIEILTGNK